MRPHLNSPRTMPRRQFLATLPTEMIHILRAINAERNARERDSADQATCCCPDTITLISCDSSRRLRRKGLEVHTKSYRHFHAQSASSRTAYTLGSTLAPSLTTAESAA